MNDKLTSLAQVSTNRFEPVKNFLEASKQAKFVADEGDPTKIRSFFQKVGSNPLVRDRALVFSPRLPFAFVTKIPKNANKNGGDTAGGVRGGMPCRPHCDERSEAQLPTETDFIFLRAIEESNLGQRFWRPQLCHLTNRPE